MNRMHLIRVLGVVGVAIAGTLVRPATSLAQTALGGGNALDSNLSTISGKYNAPTPVHDFRLANNVITGNVAGGRGFQGFVGYSAQNDFYGHLGSNDLYRFRADSAYSNPEVFGLGRTYDLMRFGQNMGQLEPIRSGHGSSGDTLTAGGTYNDLQLNSARARLDRSIFLNTSASTTEASVEPTTIGIGSDQKTGLPLLMQSSSLRGLTTTLSQDSFEARGLTMFDQVRATQDQTEGRSAGNPGTPFETRFDALALDTRVSTGLSDVTNKVAADSNAEYRKILDDIIKRYAGERDIDLAKDPDSVKTLDEQYRLLRERLLGDADSNVKPTSAKVDTRVSTEITDPPLKSTLPSDRTGIETGLDSSAPAKPKPGEEDLTSMPPTDSLTGVATRKPTPFAGGDKTPPQPGAPRQIQPFNPDAYGPMLRHGQNVPSLASLDQSRMNELLAGAEQRLHDGDYFSAERRFERALRFVPDHPMATAGIAHAQLGAGLYLSASLTLRSLFANHPEMIDVTYGEKALPPRERLNEIVILVKKYQADPEKDQTGYGFLLAYLGRQLGDKDLVQQGLKAFALADPAAAMPRLLKSVWLDEPASTPATPATMPQPEK